MVIRNQLRIIIYLLVIIFGTVIAKQVLTGGYGTVHLQPAQQLSGVVAQSLSVPGDTPSLQQPGKDFRLRNIQYFDNNTWVVATVDDLSRKTDAATVVLKKNGSQYQVVLGPGTAFSEDYLQSLPDDVGQYMTYKGIFYGQQ